MLFCAGIGAYEADITYASRPIRSSDDEVYQGCAWEGDAALHSQKSEDFMFALTSAEWMLMAIEPAEGETIEPDPANNPILSFTNVDNDDETRLFTGHGGCNRYTGGYIAGDDRRLSIPSPIATTRMACPERIMDIEMALLQMLEGARSYEIRARGLAITCETGTLRFTPAPSM